VQFIRPTPAIFNAQLTLVDAYADLREDRAAEILAQLTVPTAFWSSVLNLHPDRTRWTIELIDAALGLAAYAEQRIKHALACRRPMEYSPQIQPMILTPGHGSLPSGHSTEAHAIAYVLWKLLKAAQPTSNALWSEELMRQAARVAINRTIAGLHFPVDSAAGQLLGLTLGEYFVSRCTGAGPYGTWQFDGEQYVPAADFDWRQQFDTVADARVAGPFASLLANQPALGSTVLGWLWNKALAEWA
jgi:membrane-associated phospholipid phosphatase